MKSFSANIARGIRLRLKTGYLKEEPSEYLFMKRYPPANNANNLTRPLEAKNIPYLKLYDKVIKRNPLYVDERVYPAYWEQDITPLAIAKRQYDLMQMGLPEDEAFYKAKEYVEELEGKAFEELSALTDAALSMGASSSFATDEAVAAEIARWREKLAEVSYNELSLADQGEIDHLVHSKILKWNAVQTETRMKDPVFYSAFRELRAVVFPSLTETADDFSSTMPGKESHAEYERTYAARRTYSPFYYERYAELFGLLKEQPELNRWYQQDRDKLQDWVFKTLCIRQASDEMLGASMQRYMADVREQFFPMFNFPSAVESFVLPAPAELRQLLFEQGVGYKTDNTGLFVRRFYKLPRLLFPAETFASACSRNPSQIRHFLSDPYLLGLALEKEGYPLSLQPLVTERLGEIQRASGRGGSSFGGLSREDIPEDDDEITRVLQGSLFDELEDKMLFGEGDRQRSAAQDELAAKRNIEETKGYQQLAFLAALASNWRCVLDEMDAPGVFEALDRMCAGESLAELVAEANAKQSPLAPVLSRLGRVVDEDAVLMATSFTAKIDEAGLETDTARELKRQAYRRAFVHRAVEVFSYYYTLKDEPQNSGISFPLDMPFQELDYSHGMPLFQGEEERITDLTPKESIEVREKSFQSSLRSKLGSLLRSAQPQTEAPDPSKDELSAEEWNRIARKYYSPPKSRLQFLREEWLNNLATRDGLSWERMQDLRDENSLKFLHRKRLDVQLVARGQLAIEFENKEGARREREFKRRGVHMNVQPYPLECMDD